MHLFAYALRPYDELAFLQEASAELGFTFDCTEAYPTLETADLATGADAIAIITNPMPPALLDRFKDVGVKYICTRSIGYDHIDLAHAKKIGLRISHTTYTPETVANYTIMLMMIAARKMPLIMQKAAAQDFTLNDIIGRDLSDMTIGIVGTGNIGECIIRHLSAFGCKILACDSVEKDSVKAHARYVSLDELYREADLISLHVPALPENIHMINRDSIAKMKDGVILVNDARGLLVDTNDLLDALHSGKVAFAALDTFEEEVGLYYLDKRGEDLQNPQRDALMALPNVYLAPHMAFYTSTVVRQMVYNACKSATLFDRGEENPFAVV